MKSRSSALGLLLALLVTLLGTGCTWDSLQQTGYETVESLRRQQCLDNPDQECPAERTRYEDYQAERDRLQDEAH